MFMDKFVEENIFSFSDPVLPAGEKSYTLSWFKNGKNKRY